MILCHQKCPNASYFTWYLEVVHFHGKHPARNPMFFINHTHSQCLRANSDILVSRVQVLNDLSNLIKTNLFFPFLSSKSICLYTNWHTFSVFLWDNNTNCLVKFKWMLIKLNMLTGGTKYILCCESYPFLPKSFLFSFIKLIYFLFAIAKWNWSCRGTWIFEDICGNKEKLIERFLQKAWNPKKNINQVLLAACTVEAWPLLLVLIP